MSEPVAWTVEARNLPEHAGNRIHTDDGAREAGFPAALVAGVTIYAYLTHPLVAAWGVDWVANGGGEVRFAAPVFAGDEVVCATRRDAAEVVVEARCDERGEHPRATFRAVRDVGPPPPLRCGDPLPSRRFTLGPSEHGDFGPTYGARAGDDLDLYERDGIVHPAVWPALANRVFSTDLVSGSWIHTRSVIRHHAPGPAGAEVDVHAVVVDRFDTRIGTRAVVDLSIELDGRPLATLEHEAVIEINE